MRQRFRSCIGVGRKAGSRTPERLGAALVVALMAAALSACNDRSAAANRALFVRTELVQPLARQRAVTLTGEVQARFRADLSFRVSGRVAARFADVGSHVHAGDLLARLDPAEQQADVDAATAAEAAAEAQLRVASATFERQKTLIAEGFTTRVAFDNAQEGLRNAEASLEAAKAQLGTAKDALGYTELRAGAAGVITARNLEAGQVVQAAQPVFTLAQDGDRDAVFDVYESIFFGDYDGDQVSLALLSDPSVTATGYVREVSPAIDAKNATVRVKLAIQNPPAAMTLGSAVAGTANRKPGLQISVPWTALMALGPEPAVWTVDPQTKTVSLRPVTIEGYEAGAVIVKDGLEPGERVVVDGGKLLSPGQLVTFDGSPSS
jgi:RND family efflux transporter MFP subunit